MSLFYKLKIKKGVEGRYPEWLNLTGKQRALIKMLLNENEANIKCIDKLCSENMELKKRLGNLKA